MNTHRIINTFFFLCFLFAAQAQNNFISKDHKEEIGVRLPNLQNFGLVYKKQKTATRYTRHRLALANIALENVSGENSISTIGFGYALGTEKRKPIGNKLHFIHGVEPALSLVFAKQGELTRWTLQPAIGYIIGFQVDLSESFYINLETVPSVRADLRFNEGNRANTHNIFAGFSSEAMAITLAYRFLRNK